MAELSLSTDRAPSLLRTLLSLFSLGQLGALVDLYQIVKKFWPGSRDMYEILEYESTLELHDEKGENATLHKRLRVKFLQNNVIAFEDYVWGDGEILADYQISPGVVADRYQEGDRWNLLISLRETKNKGDVSEFHIQRTAKHGFTNEDEWNQTEIRRPTRHLQMNIIFPKSRRCQHAVMKQRRHNRTFVLGVDHFYDLPDGRQLLRWESNKVYPYDVITIKWSW